MAKEKDSLERFDEERAIKERKEGGRFIDKPDDIVFNNDESKRKESNKGNE